MSTAKPTLAPSRLENVREYYRLITEINIGQVARELLTTRITHESPDLLQCNCPHHSSTSKTSLHIILDKQAFYCFGCGVGGDVLQLAEFLQSGQVTRGRSGQMTESHRAARDFLAQRAGLPPLASYGLSPEEIKSLEARQSQSIRVQEILGALASYYSEKLLKNPEVLAWFEKKYQISRDTIVRLQIGYAENVDPVTHITSLPNDKPFDFGELASTGAFTPTSQDGVVPFFDRRIVFPYWSRGRVVFMIGRQTPWTPDKPWEQGKYKKLPVHDEKKCAHIAPCINNGVLFNEDVLLTNPESVIITEGVTDCISLMERGFPAISPVTVRIKDDDWDHLLPKLNGIRTVYICQDNEISEAGLQGALKTARILSERKIETRIAVLPLNEKQIVARARLSADFNVTAAIGPRELSNQLAAASRNDADQNTAHTLLADSKIDVNEYFASGHMADEFKAILAAAETPLESNISRLPAEVPESKRNEFLAPILKELARKSALEQERLLKIISAKYSDLPVRTLQRQIRETQREERRKYKSAKNIKGSESLPPGSCRAYINKILIESSDGSGPPDYVKMAEAVFEWLSSNGASFFRTLEGEPFLFFEDSILWMDSPDRGRRRVYLSVMFKHTGMVPTTAGGRTFFEVLASLAIQRGQLRDHFSWLHTDVTNYTVYFNLNNENHEIAKITPEGIEIIKNGGNADKVILEESRKMLPIRFDPDADAYEAEQLLKKLILDNMTCAPMDRLLILSWLSCFLLIDFSGTRPMTRFEGGAGTGKTMASKLISALIYGDPQQKKSTDAANYTDGSQNPLIALDNIEGKQLTEELKTFILTSVTGIAKEKRKSGTDTGTVTERTKCLLNTTGIEPLGGELLEVLSRSFIIKFNIKKYHVDNFLEAKILAQVKEARDLILSVMMKRTSQVLGWLRDGYQEKVMELLIKSLGDHNKKRCNEYLGLMYLMMFAEDVKDIRQYLNELHPAFIRQINVLNDTTDETAEGSNQIIGALEILFRAYQFMTDRAKFAETYQIEFIDGAIMDESASTIFGALRNAALNHKRIFEITSTQQFIQRFVNDKEIIEKKGFIVEIKKNLGKNKRLYCIKKGLDI